MHRHRRPDTRADLHARTRSSPFTPHACPSRPAPASRVVGLTSSHLFFCVLCVVCERVWRVVSVASPPRRLPCCQKIQRLCLNNITLTVHSDTIYTNSGVPVSISGTAIVKIASVLDANSKEEKKVRLRSGAYLYSTAASRSCFPCTHAQVWACVRVCLGMCGHVCVCVRAWRRGVRCRLGGHR